MSYDFDASFDVSEFERYLEDFSPTIVRPAAVSALTGAARQVRKDMRKKIESAVGLRASESAKRIRVSRANPERLEAWLFMNKARIVLRETPAKTNPYRQAVGSSRGVRYVSHRWPNAFELKVAGKRGYFFRRASGGGFLELAGFPMVPVGEQVFRDSVESGSGILGSLMLSRLAAAIERRGGDASTLFANLDAEAVA